MIMRNVDRNDWDKVKKIYNKGCPESKRRPFFLLKNSISKGEIKMFVVDENRDILGLCVIGEYKGIVMIDCLVMDDKCKYDCIDNYILTQLNNLYEKTLITVVIDNPTNNDNSERFIKEKAFYIQNGYKATNLFVKSRKGNRQVLCKGNNELNKDDFTELYRTTIGGIFYRMSNTKVVTR